MPGDYTTQSIVTSATIISTVGPAGKIGFYPVTRVEHSYG
jgi:hypothetical protein